jgi:RNA polymerase sigma-70 factor (ECF subfamily)
MIHITCAGSPDPGVRVGRLLTGLARQIRELQITIRRAEFNGQPSALFLDPAGLLVNVFALDIADGQVRTVRSVINRDKLRHLGPNGCQSATGPPSPA